MTMFGELFEKTKIATLLGEPRTPLAPKFNVDVEARTSKKPNIESQILNAQLGIGGEGGV